MRSSLRRFSSGGSRVERSRDGRFSARQGGCFIWTVGVLACPPLRHDYSGNVAVFNVLVAMFPDDSHHMQQH